MAPCTYNTCETYLSPMNATMMTLSSHTVMAVQDYPLSVENQFALIRAALQVFQKNRMTSTLTSYVFLIENTRKVAQTTLSDIAKRYPHLSPDLIARLHRNIPTLACPSEKTGLDQRSQETLTKIDQLATDYFCKLES